jgi:ribonuclease R
MRVDLDERKIDFEMAEKTLTAPIGRKRRGTEATAAPAEKVSAAPSKAPSKRPAKAKAKDEPEAYRPSDAAAKNAEVRKSRELKQALLAEAKGGSKASSGKSSNSGSAPSTSGKPAKPSKHRKGPPKAGSAPAAKSGGVRKPKAKP